MQIYIAPHFNLDSSEALPTSLNETTIKKWTSCQKYWGINPNIRVQAVAITSEIIGVSQLVGARCPAAPPKSMTKVLASAEKGKREAENHVTRYEANCENQIK